MIYDGNNTVTFNNILTCNSSIDYTFLAVCLRDTCDNPLYLY